MLYNKKRDYYAALLLNKELMYKSATPMKLNCKPNVWFKKNNNTNLRYNLLRFLPPWRRDRGVLPWTTTTCRPSATLARARNTPLRLRRNSSATTTLVPVITAISF